MWKLKCVQQKLKCDHMVTIVLGLLIIILLLQLIHPKVELKSTTDNSSYTISYVHATQITKPLF